MSEFAPARTGDGRPPESGHQAEPSPAGSPSLVRLESGQTLSTQPTDPERLSVPHPLPTGQPPDFRAGTAALAAMPDEEFEVRLVAMRRGRERITRIHRELMDPAPNSRRF
jgi:hypothetical protein